MPALTPLLMSVVLGLATSPASSQEAETVSKVFLSKTYTVDRVYRSMQGPFTTETIQMEPDRPPELLWVTGIQTEIVDPGGIKHQPKEFMCHVNVDAGVGYKRTLLGWFPAYYKRLFTLSQGQFSVRFPKGFGMRLMSDRRLGLTTQILNNNPQKQVFKVKHRVTIDYVRDRELAAPLKPLMEVPVYVMALQSGRDGHYGEEKPTPETAHAACLPGDKPKGGDPMVYSDGHGRSLTGHWVVKPGREVRHTVVTKLMGLRHDTTVHFVSVHLHPFAESLELRDLTTNKSIFKAGARGFREGIGLDHADSFSSEKGLPLRRNHEYELVSVYNNTSGVDQDAMAVMQLYVLDKEFRRSAVAMTK